MSLDAAILSAINVKSAQLTSDIQDRITVGRIIEFSASMPADFTVDGMRFLRAGLIETDTSKFDQNLFPFSVLSALQPRDSSIGSIADLCHSPAGVFVAVGASGGAVRAKKDDATTWTSSTSGSGAFYAVDSSATAAVGVDSGGAIYRWPIAMGDSSGISAGTSITNPLGTSNGASIAYGNGVFVVTQYNKTARSVNDGVTFSAVTNPLPTHTSPNSFVGFGNGQFLFISNGSAALSSDGATWTQVAAVNASQKPFYANGYWHVQSDNSLYRANDSALSGWTLIATLPSTDDRVYFDGGKFIQMTSSGMFVGEKPSAMVCLALTDLTGAAIAGGVMAKRPNGTWTFISSAGKCWDGLAVHAGVANTVTPASGGAKYMRIS